MNIYTDAVLRLYLYGNQEKNKNKCFIYVLLAIPPTIPLPPFIEG